LVYNRLNDPDRGLMMGMLKLKKGVFPDTDEIAAMERKMQ